MSNQLFGISPFSRGNGEGISTENASSAFEQLYRNVCRTQSESIDFQRLKGQAEIFIQQYQDDIECIRQFQRDIRIIMMKRESKNEEKVSNDAPHFPCKVQPAWSCNVSLPNSIKANLKFALSINSIVFAVCFDNSGTLVAFTDLRTLYIANANDGSIIASSIISSISNKESSSTISLLFSPNNQFIAVSGFKNDVLICSSQNASLVATLEGHSRHVTSFAFHPDSSKLYTGGMDGLFCIWDMSNFSLLSKKQLGDMDGTNQETVITGLAIAHDGAYIAASFFGGNVGLFEPVFDNNIQQPMNIFHAHQKGLYGIAMSSDSTMLATTSTDQTVKIWSLKGITSCYKILNGHQNLVLTVCFSPDKSFIFTGSKDESIMAWNVKTGENIFTINAHKNTLLKISHSPTQNNFVSCSGEGLICMWEY